MVFIAQRLNLALRGLRAAIILFLAPAAASRAESTSTPPTFNQDIAPIFNARCVSCHRPGEIGPMSLASYDEARPWVKSIRKSVASREMPPWDADPAVGHWSNDISLTDGEIATVLAWTDQGAPRGTGEAPPALPSRPAGWTLGEPDLTIDLPEFEVAADGPDQFPDQLVTLDFSGGEWLSAVEILPGNREVLHHVVAFLGEAAMRANAQGEAPPPTLQGGEVAIAAIWAAGMPPTVHPPGMGQPLKRKQTFTFNMHYHPSGRAAKDLTRVGLYFGKGALAKKMRTIAAINTGILIPPGDAAYRSEGHYFFDHDSQIVSLFPHMHLRGKEFEYRLRRPDGTKETLLRVPSYDFQWQWVYYPKEPISVPAGSVVEIAGRFDNSAANAANPDPAKTIGFGEQTDEEMLIGFMEAVPSEGVEFPRENPSKLVAAMLQDRGAPEERYLVKFEGLMPVSAGLVLPPEGGDGAFYFYAGGAMALSPIKPLAWEGNRFNGKMVLFANELALEGEVAPDGAFTLKVAAPKLPPATPAQARFVYRMLANLSGKRLDREVEIGSAR